MTQGIAERASFDLVRYANCWEDADVLLPALDVRKGGVYLSIASAGDNTLSMLSAAPSLVVAIDLSDAQLACVELRRAAFAALDYDQLLGFLGVREGGNRFDTYRSLRELLAPEARRYWDAHQESVSRGIVAIGKFEDYFRIFRTRVLPLIHGRKTVAALLEPRDVAGRDAFYRDVWDNFRWRLLFRVFFGRTVMGRLGRDPEFFRYVEGDVAGRILARTRYALTTLPTDRNPYLEYILTSGFKRALPFYLRRENFAAIKGNLDKLVLFKGNVAEALKAYGEQRFDGFNLSDIFEYMSHDEYVAELARLIASSRQGARLVYWNMLADRSRPESMANKLAPLTDLSSRLFAEDKAFFYKSLVVEEVT